MALQASVDRLLSGLDGLSIGGDEKKKLVIDPRMPDLPTDLSASTRIAEHLLQQSERRAQLLEQKRQSRPTTTSPTDEKSFLRAAASQVSKLQSADLAEVLAALVFFRKRLSQEQSPPIDATLKLGIVPKVLEWVVGGDITDLAESREKLRFEGAWLLCNLASGSADQTRVLVDLGVPTALLELLKARADIAAARNGETQEQIIWALGNFAGDSVAYRDALLKQGMLPVLCAAILNCSRLSLMRNAVWALSNLCRGKPVPQWELVVPALPVLAKLIYSIDDEVLTDALWSLSYLSDGPNSRIQALIETGATRRVSELLLHASPSISTPALRVIGNIVSGDEGQTQVVINCGCVPVLRSLLSSSKRGIRKEALWCLSNIAAGSRSQVQSLIDGQIYQQVMANIKSEESWDVKKEACWVLTNTIHGSSNQQLVQLEAEGVVSTLFSPDVVSAFASDARVKTQMIDAANCIVGLPAGTLDSAKALARKALTKLR